MFVQRNTTSKIFGYYLQEFLPQGGKDVSIEQLSFEQFIKVLTKDYAFDIKIEKLVYNNAMGDLVEMDCEHTWKARLEKMFWTNSKNICIQVEANCASESKRCTISLQSLTSRTDPGSSSNSLDESLSGSDNSIIVGSGLAIEYQDQGKKLGIDIDYVNSTLKIHQVN